MSKEEGRFAGWPANHGIWSWGNEILVGFSAGYHRDLGPNLHNIDRNRPEEHSAVKDVGLEREPSRGEDPLDDLQAATPGASGD